MIVTVLRNATMFSADERLWEWIAELERVESCICSGEGSRCWDRYRVESESEDCLLPQDLSFTDYMQYSVGDD